jgi:hypothetical protein
MEGSKTGWLVLLGIVVAVQSAVIGNIYFARSGTKAAAAPEKPFKLEPVPGSKLKRVILVPKAAERLGVQTTTVRQGENPSIRRAEGVVVNGSAATASATAIPAVAAAAAAGRPKAVNITTAGNNLLVFVAMTAELKGVRQDALVQPLGSGKSSWPVLAKIAPAAPEGSKGLYLVLEGDDHGLSAGQRVRVEFPTGGKAPDQLVVPYSSILYDEQGIAWVFTNPAPLTYVRAQIEIDHVAGDEAILAKGPPPGTTIVSVGGLLLLGAEILNK